MYKALVVDDERMSRESLALMLKKFEDIELVGTAESAIEARAILRDHEVNVIFLDVEMPELSGIEFIQTTDSLPNIILTTNNAHYAVEAFEYEVLDFLTKPVNLKRLTKAIVRLRSAAPTVNEVKDNIFVRSEGKHVRIDLPRLLFVETLDDYVRLYMKDGSKHIVHSTLTKMDQLLPGSIFMKCHRSYIVNTKEIVDVDETTLVIQQHVIPVSRAHRKALKERLGL